MRFVASVIPLFLMLTFLACSRTVSSGGKGWHIRAHPAKENITVLHDKLGVVLTDVGFSIARDGRLVALTNWTVSSDRNRLTVCTSNPDSVIWIFVLSDKGVDISASIPDGVIMGKAPASDARIPARIASQDNGIIHTSLGLVSAQGIYCLFDRVNDIMIQFPEGSELTRNPADQEMMDVSFSLLPGRGSKGRGGRTHRGRPITQEVEISLISDYYTAELGLDVYKPYFPQYPDKRPFRTAPTGWLSWYCYYMATNQEDMVKETDALAETLKPYGLEYVQLDACYTRGEDANWLEWTKDAFPQGGRWLMHYIKNKGLKPGLWVNAYGANYRKPAFADKYPENWFIHDKWGRVAGACCTADSTVVKLDYSHPEIIAKHVRPLFHTLIEDWGVEYLKDAGHGRWIWTYEENRSRAFDPSVSGWEAYWAVQAHIREIMGPKRWIMGCDAEGGADRYSLGFGTFDSAFNIYEDAYAAWEAKRWGDVAVGIKMHLGTIFSANYLNDIVLYNDPDATMVRPPLTMDEARTDVSTIALTGQTYMISDLISDLSAERAARIKADTPWGRDYPELVSQITPERIALYKQTMPATDITPIDLFPYKSKAEYAPLPVGFPSVEAFPRAMDLKVNAPSGVYDVVAIYNWADQASDKSISLTDLGLDTDMRYLVFDFWNQEFVGMVNGHLAVKVQPHGVRVLTVRPWNDQPQLMATSRHITGAYSIQTLKWDASVLSLSGKSLSVPGEPYSLYVFLPEGTVVAGVRTNAGQLTHAVSEEGVLNVTFQGQEEPVEWTISFTNSGSL